MFNFLKEKIKGALSKFAKNVEEAPSEEVKVEVPVELIDTTKVKEPEFEVPPVVEKFAPPKKEIPLEAKNIAEKILPSPPKTEPTKATLEVPKPIMHKPEFKKPEQPSILTQEQKEKLTHKFDFRKTIKEEPTVEEVKPTLIPEVKPTTPATKESEPLLIEEPTKPIEEQIKELKEERDKGFFGRFKEKFVGETKEEIKKEELPVTEKGFFQKLTEKLVTKKISGEEFDQIFWDLELAMLENNVAVEVIEKIKRDLKKSLLEQPIVRGKVEETVINTLKRSLEELFPVQPFDILAKSKEKKPYVICFVGINGSGKTTTIAKIAKLFQKNGSSVVLAAADTFRAAAIDQLQIHADNLGIKLIKHDYGADAAAVAFDAIQHARSKAKDVVLIDTAGRLHSNENLVDEMKKIIRVAKPDLKIFVGESITGNDCIEQAKKFNEAINIDGIILSKADIDEKGGAALSISYVTKKPIFYLGVGQDYDDIELFEKNRILEKIGL